MAAHRYWRLLITRCQISGADGLYPSIAELELRSEIGGTDLCINGTPSASSRYDATYDWSYAFDDDPTTKWATAIISTNYQHWIKYDFGNGNDVEINEISIKARSDYRVAPTDFALQYSDDNSNWFNWLGCYNQPEYSLSETKIFNKDTSGVVSWKLLSPLNMTSNNSLSPIIASASSYYSSSVWDAYHCFDNVWIDHTNGGSYWASNNVQTGWVKLDLGSGNEQTAKYVGLRCYRGSDGPERMPKDFTIQGSNDDNSWDTLYTITNQTTWTMGEIKYYTLSQTGSYRYYKIDVTANNGNAYLAIAEIFYFTDRDSDHSVIILKYRTGATSASCEAATYAEYTVPFDSEGFVQLRVEG